MKKLFLFFILFSILIINNVWAADSLTLTPLAAASSINLTATQTNLPIANVALGTTGTSGNPKTYTLKITSQYGGLKNATAIANGASTTNAIVPYTFSYGATTGTTTTVNVLTINNTSAQTLLTKYDNSGNSGLSGSLRFSRTGTSASSLFSGTYTDTITVTAYVNPGSVSGGTVFSTKTFTLTSAVVADTITLTITPTASASNLPLTTSQTNLSVGTVSITANCQNGYTLQLASAYSRQLRNTTALVSPAANEKIDYTLYFQGTSVAATSTPVTVATSSNATLYTTSTQIGNVSITYTGVSASAWKSGTYQDYLTFTLQSQ